MWQPIVATFFLTRFHAKQQSQNQMNDIIPNPSNCAFAPLREIPLLK